MRFRIKKIILTQFELLKLTFYKIFVKCLLMQVKIDEMGMTCGDLASTEAIP